ncbi:MAG: imidazole glycerol phosphate synthase subunit HisH [Ruminococcaceae bacterium]|nr:imidazole glycerol phosphate synthase subunit HisH [Oscillospiraceae bacterium]
MPVIIDYGVGNLFSLTSSFKFIGQDVTVTSDKQKIADADRLILPGVGAFSDAAKALKETGMYKVVIEEAKKGKPLLGICLGMQMLLTKSYEYGEHDGLNLIPGNVKPLAPVIGSDLKVPHIGWNSLQFPENKEKSKLYKYVEPGEHVYFVHSYYGADCAEYVSAYTEYGADITASVEFENVYGTQFHPEKSGKTGLSILKAFCEL